MLLDQISIAKRAAICRLTLRWLLNRRRMRVRLNGRWQIAAQITRFRQEQHLGGAEDSVQRKTALD
jgi:hypothetical protein